MGVQKLRLSSCAVRGRPGASAYEIAVKHGFVGTEEAWIQSLERHTVPVVYAESSDGAAYVAGIADFPTISVSPEKGKGLQIIFVPKATSASTTPTLSINGGAAVGIRLRGKAESTTDPQNPQIGMAGPRTNWLLRGVPYLMVFCGKYWLVDSYIYE